MHATKYSFDKAKEAYLAYNALTAEEKALITGAETLQTKISELSAAFGKDLDFSLTYEELFPEEDQPNEPDAPVIGGEEPAEFPIAIVIIACVAAVIIIAGAVITVLLIRKKKSAQ